ncbi:hypothetical protein [Rosistilla oblonga]|uniref:hypothetical protein n=1 Tax=Rosistilla oblonga TaxID=2527990 RepID=UPI003A97E745
MMKKILLFSSLKKDKVILDLSINSWLQLNENDDFKLDILLYDDNFDTESSDFIVQKVNAHKNIKLINLNIDLKDNYKGDHQWNTIQIDRISKIKNEAIQYAIDNNYDYLFLVDADLVLNPNTLSHLINLNKHFVFEVFWTLFFNEPYYKPNAWDYHSWAYYNEETLIKLAKKGTYEVGGGGACTLLSKEILLKGLNFNRLQSLNFDGEDRHFCTRAQALGYSVFVDTYYPAYHIFNTSQIGEAKDWFINGAKPSFFSNWLTENWSNKVIKFYQKEKCFFSKLKFFQYDIRRSIIKSYNKNFN